MYGIGRRLSPQHARGRCGTACSIRVSVVQALVYSRALWCRYKTLFGLVLDRAQ
jgi:hypothetical protein